MDLKLQADKSELFIGRQESCDVVLQADVVSRKHARIVKENNTWLLEDLGSKHGTLLNGEALAPNEKKVLRNGDQIQIGQETITVNIDPESLSNPEPVYFLFSNGPLSGQKLVVDPKQPEFILGRAPNSNWIIDDKNISRKHAKIKQDIDGIWLEDLHSKNGTWVNAKKIETPVLLKDSDNIQVGETKLTFVDSNAALLEQLSEVPAFNEPKPAEEAPQAPQQEPVTPPPEPSHLIDKIYIGLMGLVLIGLITGAYFWIRG